MAHALGWKFAGAGGWPKDGGVQCQAHFSIWWIAPGLLHFLIELCTFLATVMKRAEASSTCGQRRSIIDVRKQQRQCQNEAAHKKQAEHAKRERREKYVYIHFPLSLSPPRTEERLLQSGTYLQLREHGVGKIVPVLAWAALPSLTWLPQVLV